MLDHPRFIRVENHQLVTPAASKPSNHPSKSTVQKKAVVGRLLKLAWRYRWWCVAMLVLQAMLMGLAVSTVQWGGAAIDTIRHANEPSTPPAHLPMGVTFDSNLSPMKQVAIIAAIMAIIATTRAILNYIYAIVTGKLVHHRIVVDLRNEVYGKLQRLSLRFYSDHSAGTIINRVTGDVQAARTFVDGVLLQLSVLIMSLIFYLTFMIRIDPLLTLACLATTPAVWWISIQFSKHVRPMFDQSRQLMDDLVLRVAENADGAMVVKSLGAQQSQMQSFGQANGRLLEQRQSVFQSISRFGPVITFLTTINLVVLLIYGGYLVSVDQLPLGTGLIVFAGLLQQFSNQVANLSGLAGTIQQSLSGAARVFAVLDTVDDLPVHGKPYRPSEVSGSISFSGVWFGYTDEKSVLEDLSLEIPAGQTVAILAPVGQGKTTLLSLIPRFADPQCGSVSVDGVDVRSWDRDRLRRSVGLVLQEPILVSNTIAANIAFGRPDATDEQIRMAARIAGADHFIKQTVDGYDTVLGEFGFNLSGGQRQRIALARAIITDPPILLLDDPVSAVDPETEHEIIDALDAVSRDRTTIIVANRLSTLRLADRVIVLQDGRVAQDGTHDELIQVPGLYRNVAIGQGIQTTHPPEGPHQAGDPHQAEEGS
jgi:ATP-binding cassette, subfamily B, bacterial